MNIWNFILQQLSFLFIIYVHLKCVARGEKITSIERRRWEYDDFVKKE